MALPHSGVSLLTSLQPRPPGRLITIPSGEHGLQGGDPKLIDAAYQSAAAFVIRHMKP